MVKKKGEKTEKKNLEEAIDEIKQRFGEGAIIKLKEARAVDVDVISTGSISLDSVLGIGGIPRGRVIEIYGIESTGKSTLALHICAEAQKKGGAAAFIDAEHALDPDYAKRIGVNIDDLLISQPDSGEQGLQIVETLVRSGEVDVIVVDSVAALTPKAEIAGEMGEFQIGLQARLMSQALRKLSGIIAKTKTSVIFLNQTRMKIGVMWGCFSYDSLVMLTDGSKKKIGEIVNKQLPVEVLSYNFKKKNIESQRVIDWHINGQTDAFLQFFVQNHTGNGRRCFSCTPDHKIYTPDGWKKAKDLNTGDEVSVYVKEERPSFIQEQLLLGSVLGDGNLKKIHEQTAYFREEHGSKQSSYVKWLGQELKSLISNISLRNKRGNAIIESRHLLYFGDLFNIFYPYGRKIVPAEVVGKIGPRAMAVWYCGDGSLQLGTSWWKGKEYTRRPRAALYTNGFRDTTSRQRIMQIFHRFGLEPTWRKIENTRALMFSVSEAPKLFELIAPYIPLAMKYKLPSLYHKYYKKTPKQETDIFSTLRPMKIKKIKKRIPYKDGGHIGRRRFDISVSKNHNYFVDGCLVSNSPETTPGGLALKFYSSVRINLRRIAQIKHGDEIIGSRIKAKIVKNKVAAPFKTTEFDIYYNEGISYLADILNTGLKQEIVKKAGSWYQYENTKLGQGMEGAKTFLKANPEITKKIRKAIIEVDIG